VAPLVAGSSVFVAAAGLSSAFLLFLPFSKFLIFAFRSDSAFGAGRKNRVSKGTMSVWARCKRETTERGRCTHRAEMFVGCVDKYRESWKCGGREMEVGCYLRIPGILRRSKLDFICFLKSGSCVSVGEEGADVLLGARKQETDSLKINDSVTRPGSNLSPKPHRAIFQPCDRGNSSHFSLHFLKALWLTFDYKVAKHSSYTFRGFCILSLKRDLIRRLFLLCTVTGPRPCTFTCFSLSLSRPMSPVVKSVLHAMVVQDFAPANIGLLC
jgi:hypothetical protein